MHVFLVAGSPEARPPAGLAPAAGDRVIAVDSGLLHAGDWGWPVHMLVGDLDSLGPARTPDTAGGLAIITAPVAKDDTDLELALVQALAEDPAGIVICAALGGRPDHMLANVLLLARPDLAGRDVRIADGCDTLRVLRGGESLALSGARGDLLSLLPLGGPASGVVTDGLLYPLRDETLNFGQARGMSNVLVSEIARVSLRAGCLLICHRRLALDELGGTR